ncbi:hypothetical protein FISHEDRAFT_50052 [Fistulina hepatica ATCC 64428]|uniref:RING-14 protein n=1 Tax=Fistulina hepatica ATCC 64428 TaxID=1128425 RepID=A0A0D7A2Y0_9AGAR|nr:hypothetical protein FISHEDRAFT_50052 [Fistulina hepatica ATCC 64428]
MHFSKTYNELLQSLPSELRENTIQYRQLKKVINRVVLELSTLGLHPDIIRALLDRARESGAVDDNADCHLVYELCNSSGKIQPRLRFHLNHDISRIHEIGDIEEAEEAESQPGVGPHMTLLWDLQKRAQSNASVNDVAYTWNSMDIVIPLESDSEFFQILVTALQSMSGRLEAIRHDFVRTVEVLTQTISDTARPVSAVSSHFHPHTLTDSGAIRVSTTHNEVCSSDLYTWRSIFQLYIDTDIFESMSETSPGERSIPDTEAALKLFAAQITARGLDAQLKLRQSREALENFLALNMLILNIKKLQFANAEAIRKILKKHAKRTALPLPDYECQQRQADVLALLPGVQANMRSLSHILVQSITETLLPIIPHIDDYSCIICTSIAFKPVRLSCGHLFCVRCLVKMQKRGQADCPMCRAHVVMRADRTNIDHALVNFMQDWFPIEAKLKLKENEAERAREELEELRASFETGSCIMC